MVLILIISKDVVDVTYIKMLRSIYTKGVTAILYELFNISDEFDLTEEFFETLIITEGENFKYKSKSRIKSLNDSHIRKFEELDETLEFLKNYYKINNEYDLNRSNFNFKMIKATRNKFKKMK